MLARKLLGCGNVVVDLPGDAGVEVGAADGTVRCGLRGDDGGESKSAAGVRWKLVECVVRMESSHIGM